MRTSLRSVSGVVLAAGAVLSGIAFAAAVPEENEEVRRLLAQRLATVTKLHELSSALYVGGKATIDDVLDAQASLLAAKLSLAKANEERAKIYATHINIASELLKQVNEKVEGGVESHAVALKAEAQLLEMRIGLEREIAQ